MLSLLGSTRRSSVTLSGSETAHVWWSSIGSWCSEISRLSSAGWEDNKLKKRNSGFLENDRNLFTFFDYDYPPLKGEFGRTAG